MPLLMLAAMDTGQLAVGGGLTVAIVAIVFGTWKSRVQVREFEASRREIAAYVAEGSIKADDAERILKASPPED